MCLSVRWPIFWLYLRTFLSNFLEPPTPEVRRRPFWGNPPGSEIGSRLCVVSCTDRQLRGHGGREAGPGARGRVGGRDPQVDTRGGPEAPPEGQEAAARHSAPDLPSRGRLGAVLEVRRKIYRVVVDEDSIRVLDVHDGTLGPSFSRSLAAPGILSAIRATASANL